MPTKTIKQIADELGVDKQRVYRFIRQNHINDAQQRNGTKYYDEAAEALIKQGFSAKAVSSETHSEPHQNPINNMAYDAVIDVLKMELETKNRQIEQQAQTITQLTEALAAAQQTAAAAQALHAGTIQQQLTAQADAVPEKKKIRWPWQR